MNLSIEKNCRGKIESKTASSHEDIDYQFVCQIKNAVYWMSKNIRMGAAMCILNMLYLHYIGKGKEVLGICNVRLALLRTTILFSRKAFLIHRVVERFPKENEWSDRVNLTWLIVPTVAIFSCVFCFFWLGNWNLLQLPSEEHVQDYLFAVKVLGFSCVLEALADPAAYTLPETLIPWNVLKILDKSRFFIKTSIMALTVQCCSEYTIRAAAYGELAIVIVRFAVLWVLFLEQLRKKAELVKNADLHPDSPLAELTLPTIADFSLISSELFNGKLAQYLLHMLKQAAIEEVQQHEEHYLMTLVPGLSFADQGIYDVVSDLGRSIVSGMFKPLRYQSFVYYSRKLRASRFQKEKTVENLKNVSDGLFKFLRITAVIASSFFIFGFSYSRLIGQIYAGSLLIDSPGPLLMKTQWLLVFLKGLFEVTEAYVWYSKTESYTQPCWTIRKNSALVRLLSLGLLIYYIGSIGFAVANCFIFGFLVLNNIWFIRRDFEDIIDIPEKPFWGLLPSKSGALAFGAMLILTAWPELIHSYSTTWHLASGVVGVTLLLGAFIYTRPGIMTTVRSFLHETFSE